MNVAFNHTQVCRLISDQLTECHNVDIRNVTLGIGLTNTLNPILTIFGMWGGP